MNTVISFSTRDSMLNSLNVTNVGLHSGDCGLSGVDNEIISANYSRVNCDFGVSVNGVRSLASDVVFKMSGGDSIIYVSYWSGNVFLLAQEIDIVTYSADGDFTLASTTTVISI